jgi:hypothetical protein
LVQERPRKSESERKKQRLLALRGKCSYMSTTHGSVVRTLLSCETSFVGFLSQHTRSAKTVLGNRFGIRSVTPEFGVKCEISTEWRAILCLLPPSRHTVSGSIPCEFLFRSMWNQVLFRVIPCELYVFFSLLTNGLFDTMCSLVCHY